MAEEYEPRNDESGSEEGWDASIFAEPVTPRTHILPNESHSSTHQQELVFGRKRDLDAVVDVDDLERLLVGLFKARYPNQKAQGAHGKQRFFLGQPRYHGATWDRAYIDNSHANKFHNIETVYANDGSGDSMRYSFEENGIWIFFRSASKDGKPDSYLHYGMNPLNLFARGRSVTDPPVVEFYDNESGVTVHAGMPHPLNARVWEVDGATTGVGYPEAKSALDTLKNKTRQYLNQMGIR